MNWVIISSLVQAVACHLLCTGSSLVHWFKQWRVTFSVLGHHWFIGPSKGVSPALCWAIIGSVVQAMACHIIFTGSSLIHWFKQWRVTCSVLGHHWFSDSSNGVSPSLSWVIIGSLVQAIARHLLCAGPSLVHWFKQWRVTYSKLGHHWFISSNNGVSPSLYWVIIGSLVHAMTCHLLRTGWVINESLVQAMACHLLCTGSSLVHWFKQCRSLVQAMACPLLCTGSSLVHWFKQWSVTCSVLGNHWFTSSSKWRVAFSVLDHHWFIGSSNGVPPALY